MPDSKRDAGGQRRNLRWRLWRARRRHHHIDATLRHASAGWILTFARNDRVLLTRTFADRDAAVADATRRLADLQRAGWNTHW